MNIDPNSQDACPCGSSASYASCCGAAHNGVLATTPEALMRSRYSAFVRELAGYLLQTWHPTTRPPSLELNHSPQWAGLQILASCEQGDQGQVHFRAYYRSADGWGVLEEKSRFVREQGRWYYVNGDAEQMPLKPGRNDICPCGSGRKFKACCR